ncbi:LysM peptidoglycan-binding domain-containing protein [Streptomyces sp. NPDC007172]|uniref:LysM peptidoglycan-binding domain-containing protein n=1 Tax=Streptomyces sp. NPDC007172 TaxID=3364776 RepID=UPI00367B5D62
MRNRSTAAAIARAVLALLALTAILVGVPAVLLGIGVLPGHVPGFEEITSALTSPDTGQMFLGAITLIGWYGWSTFLISVVLETGAALRHVRAPRIRMLGGSQQLAGALVGGILVLLPAGTAMATPASAAPLSVATATVTAGAHTVATPTATASPSRTGPVHHVQDGDTLWDIAEKRLGDGIEWHRIVEANKDVRQTDGSVITADTTTLQPGWTLRLPADAAPEPSTDEADARPQTGGSTAAASTHTVRAGETLTGIAEDELGDADDYPLIVEANKQVQQADGRTLSNPDEIYPGWKLQIPATAGSDRSESKPDHAQPSQEKPAGQEQTAQPPGEDPPEQGGAQAENDKPAHPSGHDAGTGGHGQGPATPAQPDAPAQQPSAQPPAPDRERETHGTPPQVQAPDNAEAADSGDLSVRTIAAGGSILAAAVLAVVATRRARQQRRRRPKRRIPMPSGATADLEKELRAASDVTGIELADRALRTLAAYCRRDGRPLPEIEAMRITPRGVEVYLAAATPLVAPFSEHESNPMAWWCASRGAPLLSEEETADITVPYPALVSLGETEDGDAVLVNLESVGVLRLAGHPAEVRAVMLALAVELASCQLAPDTQIVLAGAGNDLHQLYPDQIEHHAALDDAVPELQAYDAFQRQALADGGHDHLRAARLDEDGGDTWNPRILIAAAAPTGSAALVLADLLASRPRTSVAVVTAADGELDLPGAWTLPAQPGTTVDLPDLNLSITLQRLDADTYDRLVELIATSSRTDDVPPPAWTGHAPADFNGPRPTAPHEEGSALAPETTATSLMTTTVAPQSDDLATALPAFTAFSPVPPNDRAPNVRGDGWDDQDGSALSPAVAGSSALDQPHDDAADSNSAGGQTGWEAPGPPQGGPPQEGTAVDAKVQDTQPAGQQDFGRVLGEVLEEQRDDSRVQPDDEENGSGLSAAALGHGPDEEETRKAGAAPASLSTSTAAATADARIIPRPSAATSTVLAALATPPADHAGPQVQVLGPVTMNGAQGQVASNRRNHLLEIAAWLVLHPGLGRQDLDNAIWPGLRKTSGTRNTAISRLRSWLGPNPHRPADDPRGAYLPAVTNGVYRLGPDVTSDWDRFTELYQQGMHHDGQDADIALAHALALVRGRPFADIDPSKYCWAEADIQEMISAIVDVAHELAERRRQVRDYRAAAQAVTKGMLVDSQSELLYRDLFTICHEMDDREGLERAAAQLARINAEEGMDSSPETVGLLRTLLKGERIQPNVGSAAS